MTVSRVGDCCHTDLLEKHSPKDRAEALYASTLPMPLTSASLYVFCPEVLKVAVHRKISDVNSGAGVMKIMVLQVLQRFGMNDRQPYRVQELLTKCWA